MCDQHLLALEKSGTRPPKNGFVVHPETAETSFGVIPYYSANKVSLPEGPIHLKYGASTFDRGFGVLHIWDRHREDLSLEGYETIFDVPRYVSEIIRPRTSIYCEFNNVRGDHRVAVVRGIVGTAILQPMRSGDGEQYYSVVTAFPEKKPKGTLVGRVK